MLKRKPWRAVAQFVVLSSLAFVIGGCEQLLVEPAADPGSITLALTPSEPDLAIAPAGANRVRIQIRSDDTVVLDTTFAYQPAQEELHVPVRSAEVRGATVEILVEIGEDARPLLRGRREVMVQRRGITDAEIRLARASAVTVRSATDVTTGVYHSCATVGEGELYCWGNNDAAQLARDDVPLALTAMSVETPGAMYQVSAGFLTTCGLTVEGIAYCWGDNEFGSLGTSAAPLGSERPLPVESDDRFSAISVGGLHACALRIDGTAYCWGFNGFGQLGDGTTTDRTVPTAVEFEGRFRAISAGYLHTCGVTTQGEVLCWGRNEFGQLGDGTLENRHTPELVPLEGRINEVTAGGLHSCALSAQGEGFCWGLDNFGQLGGGLGPDIQRPTPTPVGEMRFAELSAGGMHSCGITVAGTGYCWGYNGSGALGDGITTSRDEPVQISGGGEFISLRAGLHHSCGASIDGTVRCWGYNRYGQVGDGSRENRTLPQDVLRDDPFFAEAPEGSEEIDRTTQALLGGSLTQEALRQLAEG